MSLLDLIFTALFGLLGGLVALIPEWEVPASITGAAADLGATLGGLNGVVPIATLGAALVAVIGFRVFILAFDLVVWVYGKIPAKFT